MYKISTAGVLTVLRTFGASGDGAGPTGLTIGSDGWLWGTTARGGSANLGTVYRYNPSTAAYSIIHSFAGGSDGSYPQGGVTEATSGTFIGICQSAGLYNNSGTLFKVSAAPSYTQLYNFGAVTGDGKSPWDPPIVSSSGLLWGVTRLGGTSAYGTVYTYNLSTGAYTKKYDFTDVAPVGRYPYGKLVETPANVFHGVSGYGTYTGGTEYSITSAGSVTVNYSFGNGSSQPKAPYKIVLGSDGWLWGVSTAGGIYTAGTVFKFNPTTYALTVVYTFTQGADGYNPQSIIEDRTSLGSFLGATAYGSLNNKGAMFEVNGASFTRIFSFGY